MHWKTDRGGEYLVAGLLRAGLGIIGLSLALGLVTLILQMVALARTGNWTNYTLLDFNRYVGWQTPISISDDEDITYLWDAFLRDGSLVLTFLLYVPLIVLLLAFGIWRLSVFFRSSEP